MPQMMPINWIFSFMFFIFIFITFNIMNYYIFNFKKKTTYFLLNKKIINPLWKW